GGNLTAASGRIELGSLVSNSKVELNSIKEGFKLKYNDTSNYKDIQLNRNSLLNVSGEGAGSIQVRGRNIDINNGSVIWGQNSFLSFQPGGDIDINASEILSLNGMNDDETLRSSIVSETIGFGATGNINISAKGLSLQNGTVIENRTYTPAPSGNLNINTTEYLVMLDASPKNLILNSLATATYYYPRNPTDLSASTAIGGDVNIKTQQLSMQNGSFLATQTYGDGSGGNIQIDADAIELSGMNAASDLMTFTSIASIGYLQGDSGTIKLNTGTLSLKDGGTVSTTHLGIGNAGKVSVNATESIEVTGAIPELNYVSNISSTVGTISSNIIDNLSTYVAIGNAGDITISTPNLKISDYGLVSVGNVGIGAAGTLKIDADSVELNRQGSITATTASGEGGNIVFNLQNLLSIRNNSTVSAEAGGTGNGGNITIDSPVIVGVENSDIIANAFQGNGGNIDIKTQGIFGLQFRKKLTEESDITASSEFGVNGVVKINNLNVNPTSGAIELPKDVIDSNQQIASACNANSVNSFAITGRGGFPANPNNTLQSQIVWNDLREIDIVNNRSAISHKPTLPKRIVEATGMVIDAEGNVEFVA
ncbi:MAG: S-layer family protein, partial [Rivularia sp. (in: cyanobacteria)]